MNLLKTLGLVVAVIAAMIFLPWIGAIVFAALGLTLPIVGVFMVLCLPMVLIGVIIGYVSKK